MKEVFIRPACGIDANTLAELAGGAIRHDWEELKKGESLGPRGSSYRSGCCPVVLMTDEQVAAYERNAERES